MIVAGGRLAMVFRELQAHVEHVGRWLIRLPAIFVSGVVAGSAITKMWSAKGCLSARSARLLGRRGVLRECRQQRQRRVGGTAAPRDPRMGSGASQLGLGLGRKAGARGCQKRLRRLQGLPRAAVCCDGD